MDSMKKSEKGPWAIWDAHPDYGQTLYRRAVGDLPEMESSKALARRIKTAWRSGETILDVGCGAGHYLVSLRREMGPSLNYTGADATPKYIELAREAFAKDANASFEDADIFNLPFADESFDIVVCNNVLLHLPSIARPLQELVRVGRRLLIVRMLCGDRTFIVQDVWNETPELNDDGIPTKFNYFNIYSQNSVRQYLSKDPRVGDVSIQEDRDFKLENIRQSGAENDNRANSTTMLGSQQVNGYIIQPWAFVTVDLRPTSDMPRR
jgi:ubiquinone/menaquinone biosynthesis C-methylase UbiE